MNKQHILKEYKNEKKKYEILKGKAEEIRKR